MTTKYVYLDDETSQETASIADLLHEENSNLEIIVETPLPFGKEMDRLRKLDFNGLILDLRLDQVANNNERAEYRALALAQEIRTRTTEGSFRGFPIIMCSTDDRINKSYKKDETGHDLFDARYVKNEMVEESARVAIELECLASGYKKITAIKGKSRGKVHLIQLFGLKDIDAIDKRLVNYFAGVDGKLPNHEYARLVLKEMIQVPGVLIDEALLAARLGIDNKKSRDWNKVLEITGQCKYKGVFHEAWPRWWMYLINEWWLSLKGSPPNLSYLDADQRVEILTKATKIKNLVPLTPIKANYGRKFWAVCKGSDVPIDPIDGLMVDGKSPQPWQDKEYISIEAAIKRKRFKEGVRVHPLESDRFDVIKKEAKK